MQIQNKLDRGTKIELLRIGASVFILAFLLLLKQIGYSGPIESVGTAIENRKDVYAFLSDVGELVTDKETWSRFFGATDIETSNEREPDGR